MLQTVKRFVSGSATVSERNVCNAILNMQYWWTIYYSWSIWSSRNTL